MKRFLTCGAAFVAAFLCAATPAANAKGLRPEVGKPLLQAKALAARGNYAAAMAQIRAASSVHGLSADESFTIERLKGSIAEQAKDYPTASRTFAEILSSGRVSGTEQLNLILAEADMADQMKNYASTITWLQKYFAAGGSSPEIRTRLIDAYYRNKDYTTAAKLQLQQIATEQRARQAPTERQLQLLAACQRASGDTAGFQNTMVNLVFYYPKPDYWQNLIVAAQTRPGWSSRLQLDLDRFELALGTLTKPDDLMEMTELAMSGPLPGEAKTIIDNGFKAGILGTGPQAARQQRLAALVNKTYASELTQMAAHEAATGDDHDGVAMVQVGEEYVSYGKFDKGIEWILKGIAKGNLRHPEEAKLHLGLAYYWAGNKPQAIATLKTVGGTDGAADIAKLWLLYIPTH